MVRFIGAAMMGVGGLIAGLSGLCTMAVALLSLAYPEDAATLLLTALVGFAIPFVMGAGLFWWGRTLRRAESRPRRPDAEVYSEQPGEQP